MTETVLCVDIGTTSLKAGLITADGEVVSFSSYDFPNPQDPFVSRQWELGLKIVITEIQRKIEGEISGGASGIGIAGRGNGIGGGVGSQFLIKALSISGNGPTLVSMSGLTVRWNEAEKSPSTKKSPSGEASLHQKTGTSLFIPRILLFQKKYPKNFAQSKYIFSGPEFVIYKLTNQAVTLLPEKRFIPAYWDSEVLTCCGLPLEKMPPYVNLVQVCGYLTDEVAKNYNLPSGLPVFSAGPDFVAALIGTKTLKAGRLCDRCGSSEGFNFCLPAFAGGQAEGEAVALDGGSSTTEGPATTAANGLDLSDFPGVRSLPSVIPGLWNVSLLLPDSSKLSEKARLDFAKNALATLRNLAQKNNTQFPDKMIVTGGQAKDDILMADKARYLGLKLAVCQSAHAELLGDACLAFTALGKYQTLQEAAENIVREEKIYENL